MYSVIAPVAGTIENIDSKAVNFPFYMGIRAST